MYKTTIFKSDHIKVISQMTGSECVVLTFNEMGLVAEGDRFWGDEFFRRLNISAIGIMTTQPNWYPRDDMMRAVAAVQPMLKNKRVITYGHSQGGYGALKYSKAFNANAVLSFSPQSSINPDEVNDFDTRYVSYFDRKLFNGLAVQACEVSENAVIFFDPFEKADKLHADALSFEQVHKVPIAFSGHQSVKVPIEGGVFKEIMGIIVNDKQIYPFKNIQELIRRSRKYSYTYKKGKFWCLADGNKNRLLSEFMKDCSLDSSCASLVVAIINKDHCLASLILKKCLDEHLIDFGLFKILEVCRKHQFVEGEIRSVLTLSKWFPTDPMLRLQAVFTFERLGLRREASAEVSEILKMCVINEGVVPHIRFYANQLSEAGSSLRACVRALEESFL